MLSQDIPSLLTCIPCRQPGQVGSVPSRPCCQCMTGTCRAAPPALQSGHGKPAVTHEREQMLSLLALVRSDQPI